MTRNVPLVECNWHPHVASTLAQVERLQRKFTTIHSTLAQQSSGGVNPKLDCEHTLRSSQTAELSTPKVRLSQGYLLRSPNRPASTQQPPKSRIYH